VSRQFKSRPSRPIQLHLDSILNQPIYIARPAIENTATALIEKPNYAL